jgi:phospholipid/cholesterol/gamma-HCH transport system permease protein
MSHLSIASLSFSPGIQKNKLLCKGNWTLTGINKKALTRAFMAFLAGIENDTRKNEDQHRNNRENIFPLILDASAITAMDTSGAWQLYQWINQLSQQGAQVSLRGLSEKYNVLFTDIQKTAKQLQTLPKRQEYQGLALFGKKIVDQLLETQSFLRFIGKIFINSLTIFPHPKQLRFSVLVSVIENTGFSALGIIALLSFMIGIVLTYQMGLQLKNYGASLFIIDLLGLSILREFAPLLTAIMVAGRSGSAFTAQLGMMKLKEEIDALNTMGVLPNQLLIFPRILGLTIALPLLTVWADIFGILGGMAMTHNMLHIGYIDFLYHFPKVVQLSSLLIGIGKAPVFALIIASIACFQGLRVKGGADSVGKQTTRSVVQAIFFIIVADALFSILFSTLDI